MTEGRGRVCRFVQQSASPQQRCHNKRRLPDAARLPPQPALGGAPSCRPLVPQAFEVDVGWWGAKRLNEYGRLEGPAQRLQECRRARR